MYVTSYKFYKIPKYQRPYRWINEQVDKLWEDLYEAYEEKIENYFLGSIILASESINDSYKDVVDGQQRLTTLTILLCVIRDLFPNLNATEGVPDPQNIDINTIKNSIFYNNSIDRLKLFTHSQHQNDFEQIIIRGDTKKLKKPYKYQINSDEEPKYKFINTALLFRDKLSELSEYEAGKFINYIFKNVFIIRIDCSSTEFAIRMFQVLNDRGMDLTNADLIKSFLFEAIKDFSDNDDNIRKQKEEAFISEWQEIEHFINDVDITLNDMLVVYEYYLLGANPKKSLYDELQIPPSVRKVLNNTRFIIILLLAIVLSYSSTFTIDTEEVGVITRFGKYTRTVNPGLNFKIPMIENLYRVPVERQQKLEFGFRTSGDEYAEKRFQTEDMKDESLMLTGDLNLAEVAWVIQYRVDDAYKYLFKVRNIKMTLRDISEAAMRQIVGDRTVNEVLTVGRMEITNKMEQLVQEICDDYLMGIKVEQIVLQDVNPPESVKVAFNAVNKAQQEKETAINIAKSAYNKVIPKAKGQKEETIQKAEGYAIERVNKANGEASRFNDLYKEYVKAPEVTKRRLYLETMSKVIPKLGNVIITDQKGNNVLPLLNMSMNKVKK